MKTRLAVATAFLAAFVLAPQAWAQANAANYAFSTNTTGSLTNMSSGTTTLIGADQDDVASSVTLIGFDFYFMGVRQDRFTVNSNGSIRFGATPISTTAYDPLGQAGQALVTTYGADQRTHAGDGKVHFKVTGAAPNRVLIIEWLNMQANFNAGGTADLTYQVRLSETTGTIEFVYGSMSMSAAGAADANSSSPQFGFSSNNTVGTVGSITAAQNGAPPPTYSGAAATPVNNLYVAGPITVLSSLADGSRRTFLLSPAAVNPPGGPLTFTAVTAASMTLNWTDSSNELGYAIYVSTDGTNFTFVNTAAQNATSFNATGLIGSTTYFWRVYAVNEGSTAFLAGSQITSAPVPNNSLGTGLWSNPATWSSGVVPTPSDVVTIAAGHTVTIDTAAVAYSVTVASGGVLQFEQTTARTLTVGTDVTVQGGGILQSNPAGTQTGHSLSIGGNLTNSGTLDFSTNADTAGAGIVFTGAANSTFSGGGATNDIRTINVNKGTTPASTLEVLTTNFTVRGVTTDTVVGGWLIMTNGTLKLSGTFSGTSRVFSAAGYTIPASGGFWLNNPNYVVAAQNGNAVVNGLLRVTQGTFNQGTLNSATMTGATGAVVTIEGGLVNLAGRFSPAGAITYNQSAGTLNVATVGNNGTGTGSASFGLQAGSVFNMTGGTINLVQACTGATPVDWFNSASSILGISGTVQTGTGATAVNFNFRLRGVLPNLTVDNTTNNKTATATARIDVFGNTLVRTGATLALNGQLCVFYGVTFTNNGTVNPTVANTRFYFAGGFGATTYTGSGVVTAPSTSFEVDNPAGVTIDPAANQIIAIRFNNFSGGLTNSNKLTLGNGGTTTAVVQLGVAGVTQPIFGLDVPPVFNPGTGGVNILYAPELTGRTTGNEIPPSRTLNLLSISNPNPITIAGGDITVNGTSAGALALGTSRVITGPNTLFFNTTIGTITRTTGFVDGNFKKAVAAAASVPFEVGTANGYTPVTFNITAGTFPTTVTVAAVQTPAPGIQPLTKVIKRYWRFTAAAITADITVSYLDPTDIPGTVTEASLHFFRHGTNGPADYTDQGGTTNTAANTATITGVTQFSDWTLAEPGADLSITKTDGVATATPGGNVTYTITASNGGPGANPTANVTDNFPAGLTCSTTCTGAFGGTCTAGPFAGNINDNANIPSGGSVTYVANCAISGALSGSISNTANVSGGAIPNAAGNDSATDTDTLVASADLGITKTDGVTTATPGGSVTYTITASNAGPSAASGSMVTDNFPGVLACTWTCVGAGGGTCTASGSGNIGDTVNLPVGSSVTYTASCTISPSATGSLSNTANVIVPSGVGDPSGGNNSATDTDTLTPNADLAITKTDGVTTATAGGSVTYIITASNAGLSNAPGSTVNDSFPAPLTCTWTCLGASGGTCTASGSGNIADTVNLPAGGSVTYTASCTISPSATGTLSNTANVVAPAGVTDSNGNNNSAIDNDTLTATADLGITKTDGVTAVNAGGSTTYTITASNSGPSNATGATVSDTFPAVLTCNWTCVGAGGGTCTASGSGNINDTVNLPSGGSITYTASCTVSGLATGTLSNTANVNEPAGVIDPNDGNDSATDNDSITPSADLGIIKTDGTTTATAGGSTTYTITASNAGPSPVTGATVTDNFPGILTCTWTCVGAGGGTCTGAGVGNIGDTVSLPSGGSVIYTANCSISGAATGSLTNTATVTEPSGVSDTNQGNNSSTDIDALGASADLSITKTDGVTTATPGASTNYSITATNNGPSVANGATVTDTFPGTLTCNWVCVGALGGTCTASGAGNISDAVNLPVGGSVTYTVNCSISTLASGTLSNTASVQAPAGVTDTVPANNSATDTDTLLGSADLSITKTDGVAAVNAGGSTTYTITASNSGPSAVTGATVTDNFPASLTCTWTCSGLLGGTCPASGAGNISNSVNLPVGGSVTYTASCAVSNTAAGVVINTASVQVPAGVSDPSVSNNTASDTDTVNPPPGAIVSGTKTVTGTFTVGSNVTYTIVLTNSGTVAQGNNAGNELTDIISPTQLAVVSVNATSGTPSVVLATQTLQWNGTIAPNGGTVTITVVATILPAAAGTTVSNQGTISYDSNGSGTNGAQTVTDDPNVAGPFNPTTFQVPANGPAVPMNGPFTLLLLLATLAAVGAVSLARRSH